MYEVREQPYPMQPRERLEFLGAEKLTDIELLAILIRTGSRQQSVLELSATILQHFDTLEKFRRASLSELQQISGIGKTKAIEIRAMMELGKRIQMTQHQRFGQIISAYEFGKSLAFEMQNYEQEHLLAFYLDAQNKIIEKKTIFVGSVNSAPANPREILYHAVKNLAVGLLIAHNHPSGNLIPSRADRQFTDKMKKSCEHLGITFIDHLIVGGGDYFSFREEEGPKN